MTKVYAYNKIYEVPLFREYRKKDTARFHNTHLLMPGSERCIVNIVISAPHLSVL